MESKVEDLYQEPAPQDDDYLHTTIEAYNLSVPQFIEGTDKKLLTAEMDLFA